MEPDLSQPPIAPPKPLSLWLLAAFTVAALLAFYRLHVPFQLLDAHVYADAINAWNAGKNPYDVSFGPYFRLLYPPIFLFVGGFLGRLFPSPWGWYFYLAANFAATLALPLVLARFLFRQSWLNAGFALILFLGLGHFAGEHALASGNLACPLYLLIFLGAIPGLRPKSGRAGWTWFYLAVLFAALIKINFLLWLLLPLLAARRQWPRSFATGALVLLAYGAQRLQWPVLYEGYQRCLHTVLIEQHIYGRGIFAIAADTDLKLHHGIGKAPYAAMGLFLVLLVGGLFLLRRRMMGSGREGGDAPGNPVWITLLVVGLVLANPRLLHYDICFALPAAFVLLAVAFRIRRLALLYLALFAASLVLTMAAGSGPEKYAYAFETVMPLGAFAAGYWGLWKGSGPNAHPASSPTQ